MDRPEKPYCPRVIVVEGKYDRVRILSCLRGDVVTTEGFGVFRDGEKKELLRRLARERGLVTLFDPDGAGKLLRSFLQTLTGGVGVVHLPVPPRPGKEPRKKTPSKEGLLGVEGIDNETLLALFRKAGLFAEKQEENIKNDYTKYDLYRLGFAGVPEAAQRREAFARAHQLPRGMAANAFLMAVNLLRLSLENEEPTD